MTEATGGNDGALPKERRTVALHEDLVGQLLGKSFRKVVWKTSQETLGPPPGFRHHPEASDGVRLLPWRALPFLPEPKTPRDSAAHLSPTYLEHSPRSTRAVLLCGLALLYSCGLALLYSCGLALLVRSEVPLAVEALRPAASELPAKRFGRAACHPDDTPVDAVMMVPMALRGLVLCVVRTLLGAKDDVVYFEA